MRPIICAFSFFVCLCVRACIKEMQSMIMEMQSMTSKMQSMTFKEMQSMTKTNVQTQK
jgi:hypothetical protein